MKKRFIKKTTALALCAMTVMSFNPGSVYAYDVEQLKADYPNMSRGEQIEALQGLSLYDQIYITGGGYDQILEIDEVKYCIKDEILKAVVPKQEGRHLEELVIPEEAKEIGELPFGVVEFDRLVIHKDIKNIGAHTRSHIGGKEIVVAKDNPVYASLDGVLYSKDMTTLLAYPSGKEDLTYVVPDTVVNINTGYCLFGNSHVRMVQLGSDVKEGYQDLLAGFSNLKSVYVPNNEEVISNIETGDKVQVYNTAMDVKEGLVYCDANGDGQVTLEDANTTLRAALALEELSDESMFAVTLEKDGVVTLEHAQAVLRKALLLD